MMRTYPEAISVKKMLQQDKTRVKTWDTNPEARIFFFKSVLKTVTISIITHGQTEFGHQMATSSSPATTPNNASRLRNIRNLQEKKSDATHKPLPRMTSLHTLYTHTFTFSWCNMLLLLLLSYHLPPPPYLPLCLTPIPTTQFAISQTMSRLSLPHFSSLNILPIIIS